MAKNVMYDIASSIDAVIAWVDGNDPRLVEKRTRYLGGATPDIVPGVQPTFFASENEIRYCVLSILKFAPFVRNIFIVTDDQDPNLYEEIQNFFPGKINSIHIVGHKEIFRDYEAYLPTFNSFAIETMIWKIKGLSENFVYFNDDFILIRSVKPEDWVIKNRPVLRGEWRPAPFFKKCKRRIKIWIKKFFGNNPDYQPRLSFFLNQWNSASLLGYKYRYFFNCHTPYVFNRKTLETFFLNNKSVLEKNISYRFRNQAQLNVTTLAYHLEILSGNKNFKKLNHVYLHPIYSKQQIRKKIERAESNQDIKSVCVQSLDMFEKEERDQIFSWLDGLLGIKKSNGDSPIMKNADRS